MARILQIRRGTTEQNNNFTGKEGEITFDTEKKTLRVHDGTMLGGYALARADEISGGENGTSNFDINTVPDEFWQSLFARFSPAPFTILSSIEMQFSNSSYVEYVFETSSPAQFIRVFLVCQTPEASYSTGDKVFAFGIGDHGSPSPNSFIKDDELHVRLLIGHENFWVAHRDTGQEIDITNSNWKIMFEVYC